MNITDLAFYILASVGLAHVFVSGKIMNFFRTWLEPNPNDPKVGDPNYNILSFYSFKSYIKEINTCFQCTGFWTGLFFGLTNKGLSGLTIFFLLVLLIFLTDKVRWIHPLVKVIVWCVLMFADPIVLFAFMIAFASSYMTVLSKGILDFIENNTTLTMSAEEYEAIKNTGN